jgi:hypothetical protein
VKALKTVLPEPTDVIVVLCKKLESFAEVGVRATHPIPEVPRFILERTNTLDLAEGRGKFPAGRQAPGSELKGSTSAAIKWSTHAGTR